MFHKGNISNLISASLLGLGLYFRTTEWGAWGLAAGLFGLAGGTTNWLAVKMLFDRVPLLYGGAEPRFSAIYENFLRRGCCFDVEQKTAISRALLAE